MLLADFGAEVVKLELPGGGSERALPGFAVWNRNKESLVLDLGDPGAQARLHPLVAGADICVVNSAAAAWPVTESDLELATGNRGLIVVDVPPTSGTVPWVGGHESAELLIAHSGLALRQYSFDGGPIDPVAPYVLYMQGIWAAATATAALLERARSGFGQRVTVHGVHGAMVSSTPSFVLDASATSDETPTGPGGRNPFYSRYRCADGGWVFLAALTGRFQERAVELLGIASLPSDPRLGGDLGAALAAENRGWVRDAIAAAFLARPQREWVQLLEEGGCPVGVLAERDDWLDHPQLDAIGMRVELDDPERGPVVMPGEPLTLTRNPATVRHAAPRLGESDAPDWPPRTESAGDSASAPASTDGPLAGYRIVDLGTILAGPFAGSLLAELGADVTKVEPPTGDPFRQFGFVFNRGMRSLAIDLRDETAREALLTVIAGADVVIDNYRDGVLAQFGLRYEDLRARNPEIITLTIMGFGEPGPLATKLGFDPVLQAMSGMMSAQGGDDEPVYLHVAVNDVATSPMSVLGTCLALLERDRSGEGQRCWTSLAGLSALVQSGELVRFTGRGPARRGGRDFRGPSALDRYYAVSDGWIRLQADPAARTVLAEVLRLEPAALDNESDALAALRDAFAARGRGELLDALASSGIPATAARTQHDLVSDPGLLDDQVLSRHRQAAGPDFYLPGRFARFSRTERHDTMESPGLGEHSRIILAEAGVGAATIDSLCAAGLVVEGGPLVYAPTASYK
jgi:crotonobetainyl-CoA:carnitine CoA-transferase CaiB-like acyl-CoA transferase